MIVWRQTGQTAQVGATLGALAAFALIVSGGSMPARAADETRFAIVAPVAGSPFFDAIQAGCAARARELAGDHGPIACLYGGPGFALAPAVPAQPGDNPPDTIQIDTRSQAQIVQDFTAAHVDGIAVSPTNDPSVAKAIQAAVTAGIPVVTIDSDAANSSRMAFIGTNARDFGRALGASLKRWKPKGGKFAIVSTDPLQPNMAERISGVRDAIGPDWAEIADSPVVTTGAFGDAVSQVDRLLNAYFDVDAIICVGAWPMLATDEWRDMIGHYKARIDKAEVVLVVADALPQQKDLVRQGLGHVLVGQKPAEMGARVADLLMALKSGRKVPEVVYVGFDTFTRLDLVGRPN